jgi:hypothetical protein
MPTGQPPLQVADVAATAAIVVVLHAISAECSHLVAVVKKTNANFVNSV